MRTALVFLSVIGAVVAVGLVFGLLLRAPWGEDRPIRFRGMPEFSVGMLARRRRAGDDRESSAAPVGDADRDWDTYDSGAAEVEPA